MAEWAALGIPESPAAAGAVLARLVAAALLGGAVALVYRQTRGRADAADSFTVTLVLLAILIAMVTQVIGDNVARAFSLVGALSIVRFRTVVRDTQDTAYVIFSVAVGMAAGASNATVAVGGLVVVAVAAFILRARSRAGASLGPADLPFDLTVRVGLGTDVNVILGPTFDRFLAGRRLMMMGTARQGLALEVGYRAALVDESAAGEMVAAINRVEGVQGVTLQRAMPPEP